MIAAQILTRICFLDALAIYFTRDEVTRQAADAPFWDMLSRDEEAGRCQEAGKAPLSEAAHLQQVVSAQATLTFTLTCIRFTMRHEIDVPWHGAKSARESSTCLGVPSCLIAKPPISAPHGVS